MDFSKMSFKNKIIFKGFIEQLKPFDKIWHLKNFNPKLLFEEPVELNLFYVINELKSDPKIRTIDSDLYNMVLLAVEKKYEDDARAEVLDYMEEIKKQQVPIEQMEYIKTDINMYIKEVKFFYNIKESIDMIEEVKTKNYSDASKNFYDIYQKFEDALKLNFISADDVGISIKSLNEELIEESFREGKKIRFPKQFEILNNLTDGGATTKSLNMILGQTDIGKTRMLLNLACGYFEEGYSISYLTGELGYEEIILRMLSIFLKRPTLELRKLKAKAVHNMFREFLAKSGKGNILIKEFTSGNYTTYDFKDYIRSTKNLEPEDRPFIYMLDGINNMTAIDKRGKNSYEMMKEVSYGLLGVGKDDDSMIWVASQFNREAHGKLGNDLSKVAEGYSLSQASTFCLIAEHNEELACRDVQVMKIDKNKYAKKKRHPFFIKLLNENLFNLEAIDEKCEEFEELTKLYNDAMRGKSKIDW